MTNIIVGFAKDAEAKSIKNLLVRSGFNCIGTAGSGSEILSMTDDLIDGIVVCGYKFPDMMYSELHSYLGNDFDMLLISGRAGLIDVTGEGIMCLESPIKVGDLINTLGLMVENADRRRRKRREKPRVRSEADKELIGKAKLLLMDRNHMSEEEAHKYLQKCSMDSGTNMIESARMVMSLMSE